MTALRCLWTGTLCLLLALTGQASAQARGDAPAVGAIVLCLSHGAARVHVDADGRPTSPPQLCENAAEALFAALSAAYAGAQGSEPRPRAMPVRAPAQTRACGGACPVPPVRGPPPVP
jgi:hypothetical protein